MGLVCSPCHLPLQLLSSVTFLGTYSLLRGYSQIVMSAPLGLKPVLFPVQFLLSFPNKLNLVSEDPSLRLVLLCRFWPDTSPAGSLISCPSAVWRTHSRVHCHLQGAQSLTISRVPPTPTSKSEKCLLSPLCAIPKLHSPAILLSLQKHWPREVRDTVVRPYYMWKGASWAAQS